ncbi:MAG: hypothetical protein IH608_04495, partial [Proteobacteria bacterium]|nr:hypothetical protein [Pseudomonadota bacterium]
LVDLASLLVRADPQAHLTRARGLLEQAWETEGLPDTLRARIARDRGAVEVLAGEAGAAQDWYGRARELAPNEPDGRLEALQRSGPREEQTPGR